MKWSHDESNFAFRARGGKEDELRIGQKEGEDKSVLFVFTFKFLKCFSFSIMIIFFLYFLFVSFFIHYS